MMQSDEKTRTWADKLRKLRKQAEHFLLLSGTIRSNLMEKIAVSSLSLDDLVKAGYDYRITRIVLEALVSLGYCTKINDSYTLSDDAAVYLTKNKNGSLVSTVLSYEMRIKKFFWLDYLLKTGKKHPLYDKLRLPNHTKHYIFGRNRVNREMAAPVIVDTCLSQVPLSKVLDLGGGDGTYSRAFAERNVQVVYFDHPEVAQIIKKYLSKNKNITIASGNFFKELPKGPFDLVFLSSIIHCFEPKKNQMLLAKIATVVKDNGIIAILDVFRELNNRAALFALNLLTTDGGDAWEYSEVTKWILNAGFKIILTKYIKERDAHLIIAQKNN